MRKGTGRIWKYLDEAGLLEKASDEELNKAKSAYWKKYKLELKRRLRKERQEFSVAFSVENGDYERIAKAAKLHNVAITPFIRQSTLAYVDRKYLVPNIDQVARLEQILVDSLDEIKSLVSREERFFWDKESKISAIEKRIRKLEAEVSNVFRNPPLLNYAGQNQVA